MPDPSAKPECSHHWHDTGFFRTSNPPQREQRCCHCGAKRLVQDAAPPRHPMCGPFTENFHGG